MTRHSLLHIFIIAYCLHVAFAQETIFEVTSNPQTFQFTLDQATTLDTNGYTHMVVGLSLPRDSGLKAEFNFLNDNCSSSFSHYLYESCYPGAVTDMNSNRRCTYLSTTSSSSTFAASSLPTSCQGYSCSATRGAVLVRLRYYSTQVCSTSMQVRYFNVCMAGRGEVVNDECRCYPGYSGPRCQFGAPTDLSSTLAVGGPAHTQTNELGPMQATAVTLRPGFANGLPLYVNYAFSSTLPENCHITPFRWCGTYYNDTSTFCANRWRTTNSYLTGESYFTTDRFDSLCSGCSIYSSSTASNPYQDVPNLHFDFYMYNDSPDKSCNTSFSLALAHPCNNHGRMYSNGTSSVSSNDAYACECDPGFTGLHCDVPATSNVLDGNTRSYTVTEDNSTLALEAITAPGRYTYTIRIARTKSDNCRSTATLSVNLGCDSSPFFFSADSQSITPTDFTRTYTMPIEISSLSRTDLRGCNILYETSQMREKIELASSRSSSSQPMECTYDISVSRRPNCPVCIQGSCGPTGLCVCNPGYSGYDCSVTNSTVTLRELVNDINGLDVQINKSEIIQFWVQGSRTNSRLDVLISPQSSFQSLRTSQRTAQSVDTFTSSSPPQYSGNAVIMAKWGSPPTVTPDNRVLFAPNTWVQDYTCSDCVGRISGLLIDNTTLKIDPTSMPAGKDNERLYVAVGITGRYDTDQPLARFSSLDQRNINIRILIADPNELIAPITFLVIICVFAAYLLVGSFACCGGPVNPVAHYRAIERAFDAGFRFVEFRILRDMQVSGVNMHNLALEKEARQEALAAKKKHNAAKAGAAEVAKASAGDAVEMDDIRASVGDASSSSKSVNADPSDKRINVDFSTGVFIFLLNLVTLFAGVVKTIFNVSLMATSLSKFLPAYNFEFAFPAFSIVLGDFGDLVRVFLTILRSLDITFVSTEWNCGGFTTLVAPFLLLLGVLFLRVMLKREFLLLLSMYFKSLKKRQTSAGGKALATLVANLATAAVFYISQVIIVTIGDLSLGLAGGRNCGPTDLFARQFGFVFMLILLSLFIYSNWEMFTGNDWLVRKGVDTVLCSNAPSDTSVNQSENNLCRALVQLIPHVLVVKILFGVIRLIMLGIGWWNKYMVRAFNILPRSHKYDDDKWDVDSQQEAVIANVGRSSALIFMIAPGPTLIAGKFIEVLNNPPLLDTAILSERSMKEGEDELFPGDRMLELITDRKTRAVKYFSNMLNMIFTVIFVFDFSPSSLVVALCALIPIFVVDTISDLRG